MATSPIPFSRNKTVRALRRKARILLADIHYALALSNRAYYQGLNRF
jgi:hypothetical protein